MTTSFQPEVFEKLVQAIGYCVGSAVHGHVAEFGTASGTTAEVLARALGFFSKHWCSSDNAHSIGVRDLYLFDSFKGLPPVQQNYVDKNSPHVSSQVWGEGVCKGITPEALLNRCAKYLPKERIHIFDGWFATTLPQLAGEKFGVVHIDCDLYKSAFQVLDHLFSNAMFADGCIVLFDDWNCNRASPQYGERRAWEECVAKYRPCFSDYGYYGTFGHRVIIHEREK